MRALPFLCLTCLALFLTGCSDSHANVTDDMLSTLEEINDVMAGVTDKASADAAAKQIEAKLPLFQEYAERLDALGPADPDKQERLAEEYRARVKTLSDRRDEEMDRILQAIGLSDMLPLQKALTAIGKEMFEMQTQWLN